MKLYPILALLLLLACSSGGSDIGPELVDLPGASFKVLVRDGQDRGVSNAVVTVTGQTAVGATERNGRADLPIGVSGIQIVRIDASNASASPGDRLASLSISEVFTGAGELPYTVFLPDLSSSSGLAVNAGVQASAATLDDSSSSGAILAIASGTVLDLGVATSGTIRSASLASEQLPGRLPLPVAGSWVSSRGVFIGPVELNLVPGAALSLANDLNLNAGESAELFHLNPVTGIWSAVGIGIVDAGATRIETGPAVVGMGGLYCFATDQTIETVIRGRVLDADGLVLPGVLVRTGQASTKSAGDGRFVLPAVPSVDGQGAARIVDVWLHGGRDFLPTSRAVSLPLTGAAVDLGDLTLDSKRITQVRALVIHRGRPEIYRRFRVSGYDSLAAATGLLGVDGQIVLKDLEFGRFGLVLARVDPNAKENVLNIEFLILDQKLTTTVDFDLFTNAEHWVPGIDGGRGTRVIDRYGGGEILGADIFSLRPGEDLFLTEVNEFVDKRFTFATDSFATASFSSFADNRRVISAFSAAGATAGRVELLLERATRAQLGVFDRHALVSSTLSGIGSGNTLMLTSTRPLVFEDWYEEMFAGANNLGQYPVKLDPMVVGGADLVLGVAVPRGNLAVAEGDTTAGAFTLQRMWLARDLVPAIGSVVSVDLGPAHDASATYTVQGAVAGMDSTLTVADLKIDLGFEFPDRQVVTVARGIAGNASVSGVDVDFSLPPLSGSLLGGRHLLAWGGSTTNAGTTIEQIQFLPLASDSQSSQGFLAVPMISTPAPAATVAATGFSVQFSVPPGTLYSVIQLRSETATEIRDWRVVMPGTVTGFDFRNLPQGADPLAPGSFTLKVSSVRVDVAGPLAPLIQPYLGVLARFLSMGPGQMGVEAISSASIAVTLN